MRRTLHDLASADALRDLATVIELEGDETYWKHLHSEIPVWHPRNEDPPAPAPAPAPDPVPDPAPEPAPDPDPDPEPEPWDEDRARRTITRQREAEKKAKQERDEALAKLKEIEDAQLDEHEKTRRDLGEAQAAARLATDRANALLINSAISEQLLEQGADPKRLRRAVRLVDRDGVSVGDELDGEPDVTGVDDAVEAFLKEFPEFKLASPDPDPDPEPDPEPRGGNPDRKRTPKPLTPDQVQKLAKENPDEFNRLWEEGKIPESALR